MMLSDLLTSSRGPGVIGTILALVVLLGFGGLFVLVMDDTSALNGENIHTQIKSKEGAIQNNQAAAERWKRLAVEYDQRREARGKLHVAQRTVRLKLTRIENGKIEINEQKEGISKLEQQFEDYKKQYRIAERERAVGEEMDSLTTKDGEAFERVSVRKVSSLGMEIRHKNGFKRIHYKNLPDEMQDRFQFAEDDAKKLSSAERATVKRSVKGAQAYRESVKAMRKKQLLREHHRNIAKWQAGISKAEARIALNERKIRAANTRASSYRSLGNTGMNYHKAKKEERKADRLQRDLSKAMSLISELRKKINQPAPR